MPTPLSIAELSTWSTIPRHRLYLWERGILVGSRGYERPLKLRERTKEAVYEFIALAYPSPTTSVVPRWLYREAMEHYGRTMATAGAQVLRWRAASHG